MDKKIIALVMGEAAKSNVEKRKVGCVILDSTGYLLGKGHNTVAEHAEIVALDAAKVGNAGHKIEGPLTLYVSQPPCPECAEAILIAGVHDIEVVEAFMKFDGDKLRYDLIPPSSTKALASILTFGARKYKPNNWKECKDLDRYMAACMRHIEAARGGEELDSDSKMPHLWHAMTNLAFLIDLKYQQK